MRIEDSAKMARVTSLGVLLIVAIGSVGGILLVDTFYLRPHIESQKWPALNQRILHVENAVKAGLKAEENRLSRIASICSRNPQTKAFLAPEAPADLFPSFAENLSRDAGAEMVVLTDASNRLVGAWSAISTPTGDSDSAPTQEEPSWVSSLQKILRQHKSGLISVPGGVAVFSRADICDQGGPDRVLGHLWLGQRVGTALLERVGSPVDARIIVVPTTQTLDRPPVASNLSRSLWVKGNGEIVTVWPVHNALGKMLGYSQAEFSETSAFRQAETARRVILIVMSLSFGLVLLLIVGTHMLIQAPLVRVLNRLNKMRAGKCTPEELTQGLHGEPLVLARQLAIAFEKLATTAKTDQLTGMPNRRHFEEVLEAFYQHAKRYNRPLSVIMIDIDNLKAINDTGGHRAGDDCLLAVAEVLKQACRRADLAARVGGDEFCVVLPDTGAQSACVLAERIRMMTENCVVNVSEKELNLNVSVGVADMASGEVRSSEDLHVLADKALYLAKSQGRNCVSQASRPAKAVPAGSAVPAQNDA